MNVNLNLMEEAVTQINSGIIINVDASVKNVMCEKDYVWNPATCNCKNEKKLASVMDDSAIMCDETVEETVPINLNENKVNCKTQNFYILLHFY